MDRTDKEEFIFGSILLFANKLQIIGDRILPDLTLKQWFLLLMISKMDANEKSVNTISSFIGSSRQNVKKMLIHLESKGFISIHKSQKDSRALNVELTKKSYQYFIDNANNAAQKVNSLFSDFSDEEIDTVKDFLEKFHDCVETYNGEDISDE